MSNRHRGMAGALNDYYDDEDYYDDYDDYDYYPSQSTPAASTIKKKSTTPNQPSKPKAKQPQNTPKASKANANSNSKQKSNSTKNTSASTVSNTRSTSKKEASTTTSVTPSKQISEPKLKNISELYKKSRRKPVLNLVVIGHVDSGKSTLTGHLLLKRGLVSNQEFHKLSKEADLQNKASFKFAYILDDNETEREKGVTINTTKKTFSTEKYLVSLADAPGHRDFVPNMISGAANADVGILVIDARKGEFESGFSPTGQTKEHALIAKSLGVNKLIIAVNKMDAVQPAWDKTRFDSIEAQLRKFLSKAVGFPKNHLYFCGVSGLAGENLTERRSKDGNPCLMELIDSMELSDRPLDKSTKVSITDLSTISDNKISCLCKIETGSLQIGQHLLLQPGNDAGEKQIVDVQAIYRDSETNDASDSVEGNENSMSALDLNDSMIDQFAVSGENIGLDIKPINFSKFEQAYPSNLFLSNQKSPFSVAKKFKCHLVILGGDAQTYDNVAIPPITRGFNITCHINCNEVPGRITKLVGLLERNGDVKPGRVRMLKKGDKAVVNIVLDKLICLDLENEINSRFTVRIQGITIGSGRIREILDK